MKKILFVATVVKTHIMEFHIPYLKAFKELGWETAVAARNDYDSPSDCQIPYCDTYYDIPFERSPLRARNGKAYQRIKRIIDQGAFDIIHCHTPVGGMLARLAARDARKNGCRIIYTAHGFHFYRGAPVVNWLAYFPFEWLWSFMTDTLITINREDYEFARKHMHAQSVEYVPGVGVNLEKFSRFSPADRGRLRHELGCGEQDVLLLSVGELNENKNHEAIIRALAGLGRKDVFYAIAGQGERREYLQALIAELGVSSQVYLLGYQNEIAKWYHAADIFVLPSRREGLSVALMEAMACSKPVLCGAIRGNVDLIDDAGGELFHPCCANEISRALERILCRSWAPMGAHNRQKVEPFSLVRVMERMREIYGQGKNAQDGF